MISLFQKRSMQQLVGFFLIRVQYDTANKTENINSAVSCALACLIITEG